MSKSHHAQTYTTMSPGAIEIGPASGPETTLRPVESKKTTTTARENPQHEEHQYLDLIQEILDNGEHRPDRYVTETALENMDTNLF